MTRPLTRADKYPYTSCTPYAPVYLGAWDFDSWGFEGAVAEMAIVRGADEVTEQELDDYLRVKFSM